MVVVVGAARGVVGSAVVGSACRVVGSAIIRPAGCVVGAAIIGAAGVGIAGSAEIVVVGPAGRVVGAAVVGATCCVVGSAVIRPARCVVGSAVIGTAGVGLGAAGGVLHGCAVCSLAKCHGERLARVVQLLGVEQGVQSAALQGIAYGIASRHDARVHGTGVGEAQLTLPALAAEVVFQGAFWGADGSGAAVGLESVYLHVGSRDAQVVQKIQRSCDVLVGKAQVGDFYPEGNAVAKGFQQVEKQEVKRAIVPDNGRVYGAVARVKRGGESDAFGLEVFPIDLGVVGEVRKNLDPSKSQLVCLLQKARQPGMDEGFATDELDRVAAVGFELGQDLYPIGGFHLVVERFRGRGADVAMRAGQVAFLGELEPRKMDLAAVGVGRGGVTCLCALLDFLCDHGRGC